MVEDGPDKIETTHVPPFEDNLLYKHPGYKIAVPATGNLSNQPLSLTFNMIPDDRTYTSNHEWVKIDAEVVRMGITMPILKELGPLIALELPQPNDVMMVGLAIGTVESMDRLHEIMPPADAMILDVNKELEWDLETLMEDPYGEGWLIKMKVDDPDQLRKLLPPSAYREQCEKLQKGEKDEE